MYFEVAVPVDEGDDALAAAREQAAGDLAALKAELAQLTGLS
jgi:hypothetical protein